MVFEITTTKVVGFPGKKMAQEQLLFDHQRYVQEAGAWFEGSDALPETAPDDLPIRLIAYYLPQFHPVAVNDDAWGKGFTEWVNVTRAVAGYVGQIQPRLPGELGFYDLRQKDVIVAQAALARRAGIYGFCIHNYWFSGIKVLERPLEIILENPDIDLPFCLNWANENWTRRWDGSDHDIILEQKYAPQDAAAYIDEIASALRDPRYIRINERPFLMIYHPGIIPDATSFISAMRDRALEIGIGPLFMVAPRAFSMTDPTNMGLDALAGFPPHPSNPARRRLHSRLHWFDGAFEGNAMSYEDIAREALGFWQADTTYLPGLSPSWDNRARKPMGGTSFVGATPAAYGAWLGAALRQAAANPDPDTAIVFLNAWNEWAEGAVLEPDRHYGYAWLSETRRQVEAFDPTGPPPDPATVSFPVDTRTPYRFRARESGWSLVRNALSRIRR